MRLAELRAYYSSMVYAQATADALTNFETSCARLQQAVARDLEHGVERWTTHNAELRRLHQLWCGLGGASSRPDSAPRTCPPKNYDDFFKRRPRPEPGGSVHLSDDHTDKGPHDDNSLGVGLPIYSDPEQTGRRIEEDPSTLVEYWPPPAKRPRRRKPEPPPTTSGSRRDV